MNHSTEQIKILWLLCLGIFCYGVFYVTNVYLLHVLSLHDYGNLAVSLKVLAVLCSLLTVAKQFSLTVYLPQYEKSHRVIQKSGVALWLSKNLMLSTLILLIGLTLTLGIYYLIQNEPFVQAFQHHPFHFFLFFLPIITFFIVLSSLGLSQENLNPSSAQLLTILPSLLIVSVFMLGLYTLNTSSINTIILYVFCQSIVLILYVFISRVHFEPNFAKDYAMSEHKQWYTRSNAYWLSMLANQVSVVLSLLALEFFSPEAMVGEYAIILLFVTTYHALISPLHTYLSSQLGIMLGVCKDSIERLLITINRLQLLLIVLGLSTTLLFGAKGLSLLNSQIHHLYIPLLTAMLLFGISIASSIPMRILIHSKIQQFAFLLKMLRLITTVVLLSVLVPSYGLMGAILSDTLPVIITNLIAAYIIKSRLNIHGYRLT